MPRRHTLPAVLLPLLAVFCAGCPLGSKVPLSNARQYTIVTEDDWTLSVLRYQPARPRGDRLPVVLCHGLSYNGRFWDLAEDVSLARYLADRGYDVWVPSLRGAGWSTKPGYSRLRQLFRMDIYGGAGGAVTSGGKGLLKWNWNVDDHARHDVPAILRLVTAESGAPAVDWVGHSMGGMILVAHLAGQEQTDPRVRSFVAIAVPMVILKPLSDPLATLADARMPVEMGNAVVSTNLPALLSFVSAGRLSTPIDALFYNSQNMDGSVIRRLSALATEDISPGQFAQLLDMVQMGSFRSADGGMDYAETISRMNTPVFWMAGTVDNLATVGAVQWAYRQCGSNEKRYRLFGRVNGQSVDYGHDDLVIGRRARQEVWPAIADWLDGRQPKTFTQKLLAPIKGASGK